jgi:uncharacterized protein YcgI (DUF1989 family)/predicted amidohydrolase
VSLAAERPTSDSFTLALLQPRARLDGERPGGSEDAPEVRLAVEAVRQAAAQGAQLVCFPEAYPGPLRAGESYDASAALGQAARVHGIAVCWSRVEQGQASDRHEIVAYVHGPDGVQLVRYVRAHPATGDVHRVLNEAEIDPGPALASFEVAGVRCGLLICSELWLPEVARVLALRGALVLLAPAGGAFGAVAENWRLLARARAIENELFVGLTQRLYGQEEGSALIAGPEGELAARANEGVLLARLDLARARWWREHRDSMAEPKPFRSLPGLLEARRPELYGDLAEVKLQRRGGQLIEELLVPARHARWIEVRAGEVLEVVDCEGAQVGDLVAYRPDRPEEHLSPAHTCSCLSKLVPEPGDAWFSNHRTPLLEVLGDDVGHHDLIVPCCDPERFERDFSLSGHRSCLASLQEAALEAGVSFDVRGEHAVNVFMNNVIGPDGRIRTDAPTHAAGATISLLALVDLSVGLSACPQDLTPCNAFRPTDMMLRRRHP